MCSYDHIMLVFRLSLPYNLRFFLSAANKIIADALDISKREIFTFKNFITNKYFKNNVEGIKVSKRHMHYPINALLLKYEALEKALIVTPEICKAIYRAAVFKEPADRIDRCGVSACQPEDL